LEAAEHRLAVPNKPPMTNGLTADGLSFGHLIKNNMGIEVDDLDSKKQGALTPADAGLTKR